MHLIKKRKHRLMNENNAMEYRIKKKPQTYKVNDLPLRGCSTYVQCMNCPFLLSKHKINYSKCKQRLIEKKIKNIRSRT